MANTNVKQRKTSGGGGFSLNVPDKTTMRIFLWGTGLATGAVIDKEIALEDIELFIDTNRAGEIFMGKPVISPVEAQKLSYDAIVVTSSYAQEIYQQSRELGFDTKKMIFMFHHFLLEDLNQNYELAAKVFRGGMTDAVRLQKSCQLIRPNEATRGDLFLKDAPASLQIKMWDDYARLKTFELVVKEINKRKIPGDVAEFGVFRGDFAKYLNCAFPNRTLYLFDTFTGFDEKEATEEKAKGFATGAFVNNFKRTDVDIVMEKMIYPDNVVIKKGIFPDSLDGLETSFAFVSIDVDFEASTLAGLEYFYPRLLSGGYIFIHDYNHFNLAGVERAVDLYEQKCGRFLNRVPICDVDGTLVITKQ